MDIAGERGLIDIFQGFQKLTAVTRDPRVAMSSTDLDDVRRSCGVHARLITTTIADGAVNIEMILLEHLGLRYPIFGEAPTTRSC